MIKNWLIRGDIHGDVGCLATVGLMEHPEETAIIILGDVAFNYSFDSNDEFRKKRAGKLLNGGLVYCLRGNHEARPADVEGMIRTWDENVLNFVWMQPEYPHIRYFIDGEIYWFGNKTALTIGGAYSVDKHWRLQRGQRWFANEQLSAEEMKEITNNVKGKYIDMVFSHTCPKSWQPTDLFLSFINQDEVDDSMEVWMDELKDQFVWSKFFWGHYHSNRDYHDGRYMLFDEIMNLEEQVWAN